MRNTFNRCLLELMDKEEQYLLTGDLGFSAFEPIREKHPEYFLNMGLAEQNMVGVAAGMAHMGKKVFVYSIIPFIAFRAFEQIRDDVCYPCLPVRFVGVGAGLAYGGDGPTHHSYEDMTLLSALPGMTVLNPSDPKEVEAMMRNIHGIDGPSYLRLPRSGEPSLHDSVDAMQIGSALELAKGDDILFVSTGAITGTAMEVAKMLEKDHVSTELLEVHTLKPFDSEAVLKHAKGKKAVFTLEEEIGCLRTQAALALSSHRGMPPLKSFSLRNEFFHVSGSREYLLQKWGLDKDGVYDGIRGVLNGLR